MRLEKTKQKHLVHSSLWIMFFFMLSRVTGMFKIIQMSSIFGTGIEADAFTTANQLPELFTTMISGGAFSAALIPIYTKYLFDHEPKKQMALANTALTIVFGSLTILAIGGILLATPITQSILLVDSSLELQQLTAELIQILMISMVIVGGSGVFSAILNAHQHFVSPAIASVTIDIGHIVGLLFLVPLYGIKGAAYGSVIGAIFHLLTQIPALVRYSLTFKPALNLKLAGTRKMLQLLTPRMIMLGTQQLVDIWLISLSSGLPEGVISAYFYAQLGMYIPTALFSQSIVIPLFPTMASYFNQGQQEKLSVLSGKALHLIIFLVAPASLSILLFGRSATRLLMERGSFDATSTTMVATILSIFTLRMIALALIELFEKLFFARQNTRTPMWGYIIWLFIHSGLAYILVKPYGIYGIAWASSIATAILAIGLGYKNLRIQPDWVQKRERRGIGRVGITIALTLLLGILLPIQYDSMGWMAFILWNILGITTYLSIYTLLGGKESLYTWGKLILKKS